MPKLDIEQVEAIVKDFLKQRYPKFEEIEISRCELIHYTPEWWVMGNILLPEGGDRVRGRVFTITVSDENGEVLRYDIKPISH